MMTPALLQALAAASARRFWRQRIDPEKVGRSCATSRVDALFGEPDVALEGGRGVGLQPGGGHRGRGGGQQAEEERRVFSSIRNA